MTKTPEAMRAYGYVRISKADQGDTSPKRQRDAIARMCRERGWVLAETFEDIGVSATAKRRPSLDRMMSRLGDTDAVVVYRLDRLARSQIDFAKILERFATDGVSLAATDMEVDNDSPAGTLIRDLVARLAQFERDTIASRSKAMHDYKRAQGEPVGRVPFGWRRNGKGYEPDPAQQAILRDAAKRYVKGETFSGIARQHGLLVGPLSRMLGSERVQDALPADLADDLRAALAGRKWQRVPTSSMSLLGGIARCALCDGGMTRSSTRAGRRQGSWAQYRCVTKGHVGISAPWLDDYVSTKVIAMVDTGRLLDALRKRKATGQSRKASEIEARIDLLDEMLTDGKITQARYERMNSRLIDKLAEAQRTERENGIELPVELARDLGKRWNDLSIEGRRRIIMAVVDRIVVDRAKNHGPIDATRVEVVWRSAS